MHEFPLVTPHYKGLGNEAGGGKCPAVKKKHNKRPSGQLNYKTIHKCTSLAPHKTVECSGQFMVYFATFSAHLVVSSMGRAAWVKDSALSSLLLPPGRQRPAYSRCIALDPSPGC